MSQRPTRNKRGAFMEGKGFYIVLFLCVAAIGISGYYFLNGLLGQPEGFGSEAHAPVSGPAEMEQPPMKPEPTPPAAPQDADQDTAQDQGQGKGQKPGQEKPGQPDQTPDRPRPKQPPKPDQPNKPHPDEEAASASAYVWPVQGSIERDFSLEVFAYDATMGDWRTHEGIDLAAELGAPVSACASGTVKEVRNDDMLGMTVVLSHGKGMESVYANLAETVQVQKGQTVDAGTVLGTVGTTAISESASPSHLHFEMKEYGVSVDPSQYLH